MNKKLTALLLSLTLPLAAQTNKYIAIGFNTNNVPTNALPFAALQGTNSWTTNNSPGAGYFLASSNATVPFPHWESLAGYLSQSNQIALWSAYYTNRWTPAYSSLSSAFSNIITFTATNTGLYRLTYASELTSSNYSYDLDGTALFYYLYSQYTAQNTNTIFSMLSGASEGDETHVVGVNTFWSGSRFFLANSNTTVAVSNYTRWDGATITGGATNITGIQIEFIR